MTSDGSAPLVRAQRMKSLDLLEADFHQQLEQRALAVVPHRIGQGLVAVAQIDRAPGRGLRQRAIGPTTVGQLNALGGLVTFGIE
jgi:hypothetical protein